MNEKKCESWQGVFDLLMKEKLNLELLCNLSDNDPSVKKSRFTIPNPAIVKHGAGATIGSCGEVDPECATHEKREVEAIYPLVVNRVYDSCECDINADVLKGDLDMTINEWVNIHVTYLYNILNPKITDDTTLILNNVSLVNIQDRIIHEVGVVAGRSNLKFSDLTVVLSTEAAIELMKLKFQCCDYSIQTSEAKSLLAQSIGVRNVIVVPTNELSGNLTGATLTPQTKVSFAVYPIYYAPFKIYCDEELNLYEKQKSTKKIGMTETQLAGSRYIGANFFADAKYGGVVYQAITVI